MVPYGVGRAPGGVAGAPWGFGAGWSAWAIVFLIAFAFFFAFAWGWGGYWW
ncbi:hypothetical protein [Effusibacillus dendaii]|uniref:Uncharacterized protein n=1 Tax=Effusibacillus dendaii TaxID=2743772 RepID=A0A7I8DCI2_9BACL|nr:hypothetical protein [Effusibacillus dendaii]BCJ87903.1 hypothetical protein skT53_28880 [Effusibacillus dendaii]